MGNTDFMTSRATGAVYNHLDSAFLKSHARGKSREVVSHNNRCPRVRTLAILFVGVILMSICHGSTAQTPIAFELKEMRLHMDAPKFSVGDAVAGNWKGAGQYYAGKVDMVGTDTSPVGFQGEHHNYYIKYDDGDEEWVPEHRLRSLDQARQQGDRQGQGAMAATASRPGTQSEARRALQKKKQKKKQKKPKRDLDTQRANYNHRISASLTLPGGIGLSFEYEGPGPWGH